MTWSSISSSKKTYGLLAVIVGVFCIFIIHNLRDIQSSQTTAVEVTGLNHWNASQSRFELERTIRALDGYAMGLDDVGKEDLLARFDIFSSRLPTLYQGEQSQALIELTDAEIVAPEIMRKLDEMRPAIAALRRDDRQAYEGLRGELLSFQEPLQAILLAVHHAHGTGESAQEKRLQHLYAEHAFYLLQALLGGVVLIMFLLHAIWRAATAQRAAQDAQAELEGVINALPLSVDAVDKDGRLVLLNDYARNSLKIGTTPWLGKRPEEIGMDKIHEGLNQQVSANGLAINAKEIEIDQTGARRATWLVSKVPVIGRGDSIRRIITVAVDITDRKEAEARVQYLAHHDPLTGLPNRTFFQQHMASFFTGQGAVRTPFALLYADFDRFKEINDRLGHEAGDRFLVEASQRLVRHLPPCAMIARLGGDEFAIIQKDISGPEDARRLAETLTDAFKQPIDVGGERWLSTISVGISLSNDTMAGMLFRQADLALYEAKAFGGNTYRFFTAEMSRWRKPFHGIQQDLRGAIGRDELLLQYQPKIRLCDRKLSGFEALLRWNHARHGLIAPSVFVPVAENSDLILTIGQWVLQRACAQIAAWEKEGIDVPPIAVNMSAAQFMRQNVVALVESILDETGAAPERLELEVTESILMDNSERTLQTLRACRAMNIGISLDDFGTGYSSLHYLQRFPIDKIKIDKTFVQPIARVEADLAIIRAIIDMAHSLDVTVVAEGVETERQRDILSDLGCDEIQGFLISPARQPDRLEPWLRPAVKAAKAMGTA